MTDEQPKPECEHCRDTGRVSFFFRVRIPGYDPRDYWQPCTHCEKGKATEENPKLAEMTASAEMYGRFR